jgi:hypothetical protein
MRGFSRPMLMLLSVVVLTAGLAWFLLAGIKPNIAAQASGSFYRTPDGFSSSWKVLGKQGSELGDFQQPRGVTGLADGSFVVVDRAARVQHIAEDGKPLGVFCMKDHDLGNPKGLCALPNGHLLICDTHYGRLMEMSVEGEIIKVWGHNGFEPGCFTHPMSAALDLGRNVVYIVNYGDYSDCVDKFTLDGKYVKRWGKFGSEPSQFQRPSGVAVDSEGSVYVADSCNHRVQKFDPDGNLIKMFGEMGVAPGQLRYPYDIARGPGDLLYVVEFNNHRVSVFDKDGTFVKLLGGPGTRSGEFQNPWSLTVDQRDRLIVSDTANFRVQILELGKSSEHKFTTEAQRTANWN